LSPDDIAGLGQPAPPAGFALHGNAPNPFNPGTSIRFDLPVATTVRLTIYTVDGRRVRQLVDEPMGPGEYGIVWNGRDDAGNATASGVYLYRLDAGEFSQTRRMTMVR
jgi:hypothetical protein